ncbi:TonB dependent receptor [Azotobacter beijerinckii]|uniref:TonB dependent receptor n=1 Tax=Azotobacter beijerinckii TaxID=170623 RepID=A0A1H9SEQ1_9GAMM|nr:TonB dependent receptor [Azotobacter beijerinckii]
MLRNAKVSDGSITSDADGNPIIDSSTGEETSITVYKAVDEVIRKGFEVSFQGRLGGAWSYELGWTYYDANDEDGQTGSEVPDNKYNARLGWQQGPWSASLSAVRVDSYLSYGYTVGDFTTVNLNLTRELGHGVSVALFGQNLADERYATNNKGYPATANWGVLRDVGATYGTELRFRF